MIENAAEIATGGAAGIVAIALILRKFQSMWAKEGSDISTVSASQSVVNMMRTEMLRMAKVNDELAIKLNSFQTENIELKDKIGQLTSQVTSFQQENVELREELIDLKGKIAAFTQLLEAWDSRCATCEYKPSTINSH